LFGRSHDAATRGPSKRRIRIGLVAILLGLCNVQFVAAPARAQQSPAAAATPTAGQADVAAKSSASTKDAAKGLRKPVPDCAGGEAFRKLANTANSPAIVYNGNMVPAGSLVDFGLTSALDSDAHYFALLIDDKSSPRDDSRHGARARKAGDTDDLVQRHLLSAGDTIVSIDVAADAAGLWTKRNLYIYQCDDRRSPFNVSYLPVYVSPPYLSGAVALLIVLAVYFLATKAFVRMTGKSLRGTQAWNPIRFTAGPDNRGSLSSFQIFFFTILVFGMLTFVLLRTGVLSDLSTTILELLGISGLGAAAAKGTDSTKTTLDPTNQAWLLNKGWYDGAPVRPDADPSFYDLISSDGNFDVYRFQSFVFTVAVGIALLIGGIAQLASFTIPQNILGILGLSQVVYIAGKLVTSSNASRLNTVVAELRDAEAEFRQAAFASGAVTLAAPITVATAVERAPAAYSKYLEKAKGAAKLFKDVVGRTPDPASLQPSIEIT